MDPPPPKYLSIYPLLYHLFTYSLLFPLAHPSICPLIHPHIPLAIHLSIYTPTYPSSTYLPSNPFVHLFIQSPIHPFISQPIHHQSMQPSTYLSISPSNHLSILPSIYSSTPTSHTHSPTYISADISAPFSLRGWSTVTGDRLGEGGGRRVKLQPETTLPVPMV